MGNPTKNASKYHIFIPGMAKSDKIMGEMLSDYARSMPKVIYFDKNFGILGTSPNYYGKQFLDFLETNYTTLLAYKNGKLKYKSVKPVEEEYDIEAKLYIRKNKLSEVIQSLLSSGYIKEENAK